MKTIGEDEIWRLKMAAMTSYVGFLVPFAGCRRRGYLGCGSVVRRDLLDVAALKVSAEGGGREGGSFDIVDEI